MNIGFYIIVVLQIYKNLEINLIILLGNMVYSFCVNTFVPFLKNPYNVDHFQDYENSSHI